MIPPALEAFLQAWITLTALAAIWLLTENSRWARWGFVVGMLGQPGWLLSTWLHGQIGMFVVSIAFTVAYGRGIWKHWIAPRFTWPSV